MTGLVIISHSHRLAEGLVELVRQVGGEAFPVAAAGGLDGEQLGTNPERIAEAIRQVGGAEGALVLMDLGSALLSGEMALELLTPQERERVRLVPAPLVEGAVAAAAVLAAGGDAVRAAEEAAQALQPKLQHLGPAGVGPEPAGEPLCPPPAPVHRLEAVIPNPNGLHARPAARLVREAARFDARIWVRNARLPQQRASAASINELTLLDLRQGDTVILEASGPEGREAVERLGELVRSGFGEAVGPAAPHRAPGRPERAEGPGRARETRPSEAPKSGDVLDGVAVTPGLAWGRVQLLHRRLGPAPGAVRSPQEEWEALQDALERVRLELARFQEEVTAREGAAAGAIFEVQALFLRDPLLLDPAREAVEAGIPAAQAWIESCHRAAQAYRALSNPLLRQRAADVEDLGQRVRRRLTGAAREEREARFGPSTVLVVDELWPSDVEWLREVPVAAVCTARGDSTAHAALLARALAFPVVIGLGEAVLQLATGTEVAVDGVHGGLYVEPDAETARQLRDRAARWQELEKRAREAARRPARLRDGRTIAVAANVGTPAEARLAARLGAEGIGLFRTEALFLGRREAPDAATQEFLYRQVAEAVAPHPVVLRTLDVGGDKPLPYISHEPEANPFLGVRGIRLTLRAPELLEEQVRAALRVAAGRRLRLMLPMVSTLGELVEARRLVEGWRQAARRAGQPVPSAVEIGIMVEVPAAALLAERLAEKADFFSIGTNDLTQYTLAADRGNPGVRHLLDGLHPAVLRLIQRIVAGARRYHRPVAVCGELASDREAIPVLVGLGVDGLSMAPHAIPVAKAILRELDMATARALAREALALRGADEVRQRARRVLAALPASLP